MFIHSDTLTQRDVYEAALKAGDFTFLADFTNEDGRTVSLDQRGSRSHARRYEIRLSGSSKSTMDTRRMPHPEKSATWDEWGNFIAALFRLDIHAKIGHYSNLDHFIAETTRERDRIRLWGDDKRKATHTAPWLQDNDLIFASVRGYYGKKPLTQSETVAMFRAIDEARANNAR